MLNINITKSLIDLTTETVYNCPKTLKNIEDSTEICINPSINLDNTVTGFAALVFEKLSASCNAAFKTINTGSMTLETNETVHMIQIIRTKDNAFFFDILNKLGIAISILNVGACFSTNTLYLENVLKKKIMTLPPNIQASICMYLLTLTKFLINFNWNNSDMLWMGANEIGITKNLYSDLNNYLINFSTECTLVLKELPSSSCKTLTVIKNEFLDNVVNLEKYTMPAGSIFNAVITTKNGNSNKLCVDTHSGLIIFDETSNMVLTKNELTYLDLFDNPLFNEFAYNNCRNLRIKRTDMKDIKITVEELDGTSSNNLITELVSANHFTYLNNIAIIKRKYPEIQIAKTATVDLSGEYTDDKYAQILLSTNKKDYYDNFDLKDLKNTVNEFAKGNTYSMFFIGESGTGKSTAAKVIPYLIGMPALSINFSNNIEESDLFGTLQPNYNRQNSTDPEFVWNDGLITKAIRNGYCLVLEEVNFARPGVLGKLNSLLDENRQIDLQTGEVVTAHKNFRIIATGNMGYEGTHRLNKAFVNRFEIVKVFEAYSRDELKDIISTRTQYTNKAVINKVLDVYESILKYGRENNAEIVISVRQLINTFKNKKAFKNVKDALINTLINSAFAEDEDLRKEYIKSLLPSFNLNIAF